MMMGWSAAPGCAAIAKVTCESRIVETVPSKIALVAFMQLRLLMRMLAASTAQLFKSQI